MTVLLEASLSVARAVMPTAVPVAAFSATWLAALLPSMGEVTSNSSTSVIAMVKLWAATLPSALAAWTVMVWEALAS